MNSEDKKAEIRIRLLALSVGDLKEMALWVEERIDQLVCDEEAEIDNLTEDI